MNKSACFVLALALSSAFVSGEDLALRVGGYLAAAGVDPGLSSRGVFYVRYPGGPLQLSGWDENLLGVPRPEESELPSLAEAESAIVVFKAAKAAAKEQAAQNAKSQDQKILENEYFALVEEIYDAAGEEAPDLETAKNLGQARAKIAKARQNKLGTGQGGKKTADDMLEFLDMQVRLQGLDLELRGYDPNWRGNAKKHELE